MEFEVEIIKFLQAGRNPFFDTVFQIISQFASVLGVVFACLLFLLFNRKLCFWYLFSYGFAGLFIRILKGCVQRIRPFNLTDSIVSIGDAVTDFSFPSGHAACATAIAIFVAYFLFQKYKQKGARVWIVLAGVMYVGLVCVSRMYLGKHYLTDVLVGCFVSAIFCILGIWFMKYCQKIKEKKYASKHDN